MKLRRLWPPALLALVLLVWGFAGLSSYNVTWDEALGDLFFGERYLSYFTSFDPAYLDFTGPSPYPEGHRPDLSLSPFKGRPWEYYPVANTLAAATAAVFSKGLGWLDPFDGFHALNLLLAAVFVCFFYSFLERRHGALAALLAAGFLLSAPRIAFHMMANIKDFPLMVFYGLTLMAFMAAYEAGSVRGLLAAGVLWGLTLGTKANALFLPGTVLLVVLLAELPEPWRGRRRALWATFAGIGFLGPLVMLAVWPYLWADPIGRFGQHLSYIGLRGNITRAESIAPPFEAVALTTPPLFLLLALAGIVLCVFRVRSRDRMAWFWLGWVAVTLGRFLLPQAVNFDGVRHFLELFPALAALAGIASAEGIRWCCQRAKVRIRPRLLATLLAVLLLLPSVLAVLRTHPFEIAYWNLFTGGYAGARQRGLPQASDYWGASYRLGMEWLNAHAEENALLAVPVVEHAVRLVAPERLRPDIFLLPVTTPFSPRIDPRRLRLTREAAEQRPLYVMFVPRRDWTNQLMRDCLERLQPVVSWELEGAPVLLIYRYPGVGGA